METECFNLSIWVWWVNGSCLEYVTACLTSVHSCKYLQFRFATRALLKRNTDWLTNLDNSLTSCTSKVFCLSNSTAASFVDQRLIAVIRMPTSRMSVKNCASLTMVEDSWTRVLLADCNFAHVRKSSFTTASAVSDATCATGDLRISSAEAWTREAHSWAARITIFNSFLSPFEMTSEFCLALERLVDLAFSRSTPFNWRFRKKSPDSEASRLEQFTAGHLLQPYCRVCRRPSAPFKMSYQTSMTALETNASSGLLHCLQLEDALASIISATVFKYCLEIQVLLGLFDLLGRVISSARVDQRRNCEQQAVTFNVVP